MKDIYKQLSQVKIITNVKPKSTGGSWFILLADQEPEEVKLPTWTAIYHTKYNLYIVTDDINISGLNDEPELIRLIGYSQNEDYVMFMIYEHQISRNEALTIFHEIKEMNKNKEMALSDDNEWKWNEDKKSSSLYSIKPSTNITFDWSMLIDEKYKKGDDKDAKN